MKRPTPVAKIDTAGNVVKVYRSVKEAAFLNGVTPSAIYKSVKEGFKVVEHYWTYQI